MKHKNCLNCVYNSPDETTNICICQNIDSELYCSPIDRDDAEQTVCECWEHISGEQTGAT